MAHSIHDRVKETSISVGTGNITLLGAVEGFQSFDDVLDIGDTTWYAIEDGENWEVGLGTLSGATTLVRTTVYDSSNGGSAVNFPGGEKIVFMTVPANQVLLPGDYLESVDIADINATGTPSALTYLRGDGSWATVSGSAAWGAITGTLSNQTDLQTALNLKAPLASPALTGTPTAPTAAAATNTTQIATTAFVRTEVTNLINSAPSALDTLDELAAALGDDANFASTVTTALAGKASTAHTHLLAAGATDVTASAAELNILDGATLTTTELNYVDGVTSAIQTQLNLKANDADVVHDTGAETIAGVKTFSSDPLIPDEAYGAGWNGSLEPPTKNAVYDKVQTLGVINNATNLDNSIGTEIGLFKAVSGDTLQFKSLFGGDGITVTTDGANNVAIGANPGDIASLINLDELADVDLSAADDNYVIAYDLGTSTWIAVAPGAGAVDTANSPNANEYARFTDADTIEGRTASETRTDLGLVIGTNVQAHSANLDEYAAVNPTGAGLALLDDATAADQLVTLGLTATAAELNALDGITATVTELNYTDGVTSAIQTQLDAKQASDTDLTAIAGLSPSNDDVIQRKAGAWTNRTMAQVKTDLALAKGDVGLGNVDNTSDATKNAAAVTLTNKTLTSPVINSPTGIVKGDIGLGNVDNTSNATERAATRTLTNARITKRSLISSNDTTFDIDTDAYDYAEDTGLTGAVTVTWSGTPTNGQTLWVSLTGTAARAITWDSDFEASTVALPTTTVSTNRLDVGFIWNAATSKFRCVASA